MAQTNTGHAGYHSQIKRKTNAGVRVRQAVRFQLAAWPFYRVEKLSFYGGK